MLSRKTGRAPAAALAVVLLDAYAASGIDPAALAAAAEIEPRTLIQTLTGRTLPHPGTLERLARRLELAPGPLLELRHRAQIDPLRLRASAARAHAGDLAEAVERVRARAQTRAVAEARELRRRRLLAAMPEESTINLEEHAELVLRMVEGRALV